MTAAARIQPVIDDDSQGRRHIDQFLQPLRLVGIGQYALKFSQLRQQIQEDEGRRDTAAGRQPLASGIGLQKVHPVAKDVDQAQQTSDDKGEQCHKADYIH